MSAIDDLVQQSLEAQKGQYIAEIEASKSAAQAEINEASNKLNDQARDLDANFLGFLTGAIAPLYKTSDSRVNIRDPFFGQASSSGSATPAPNYFPLLIFGGILYFLLRKKRGR